MAIRLIQPPTGRRQSPLHYTLEITPDEMLGEVALVLVPRQGPTLRLLARQDDALEVAWRLIGAVVRLREGGSQTPS